MLGTIEKNRAKSIDIYKHTNLHYVYPMVTFGNMGWIWEKNSGKSARGGENPKKSCKLGILAFETGRTMSKLVSLYNALSDGEIFSLSNDIPMSKGIVYLNSMDEGLVLSLACTERLEDLDKVAAVVSRLGQKCKDPALKRFDLVYADYKLGIIDQGKLQYGSKEIEKTVEKMKKMISATSGLYTALEFLTELEVSEKKLKKLKDKAPIALQKTNFELFSQRIEIQRKQVRQLRENSLWNETFDKNVSLMARLVCILYARICVVFGPYVPIVPSSCCIMSRSQSMRYSSGNSSGKDIRGNQSRFYDPLRKQNRNQTVPISNGYDMPSLFRNRSDRSGTFLREEEDFAGAKAIKNNRVFHAAGSSTVGGSGLALRYANIIVLVENYLDATESTEYDSRDYLYELLPENLKSLVRLKLMKNMKDAGGDDLLAEGWREAMREIMAWLSPMAHDTIQWHMERSPEKTKFDSKPTVVLLQTLHFSDKEKTEAAIAEVLVALSCICRYESIQPFD